jgi:predicted regulator of Ras-like GTPase activity (Roadblock/LC7/MglB family)
VDAQQALADLTEISSQIQTAVLLDAEGKVAASTLAEESRASQLAGAARELLAAAETVRSEGGEGLTQLEVATAEGSVFVVREAGRTIAATTSPEPTVGLVFYDLKSCLRSAAEDEKPSDEEKPKRTRKKAEAKEAAESDAT